MVSDFIVMHPSGPFFRLSDEEYQEAISCYPELNEDSDVEFLPGTATGSLAIGTDGYFDNQTVLEQFERLFKLMRFKKEFDDHRIEIIVDNARTHTARAYGLNDFGKTSGTRCPVDTIEYLDEGGQIHIIDTYFKNGSKSGLSKGLLEIARELGFSVSSKIKLDDLRNELSQHPAFSNVRFVTQKKSKSYCSIF